MCMKLVTAEWNYVEIFNTAFHLARSRSMERSNRNHLRPPGNGWLSMRRPSRNWIRSTFCNKLLHPISWKSDNRFGRWNYITDGRTWSSQKSFIFHFVKNAKRRKYKIIKARKQMMKAITLWESNGRTSRPKRNITAWKNTTRNMQNNTWDGKKNIVRKREKVYMKIWYSVGSIMRTKEVGNKKNTYKPRKYLCCSKKLPAVRNTVPSYCSAVMEQHCTGWYAPRN